MNLKKYLQTFLMLTVSFICCKNSGTNISDTTGDEVGLQKKVLVQNLTHPWEILWGPDNFIWMTERDGKISRINPSNGKVTVLTTVDEVAPMGEGGLLGMALHPKFSLNPYVFVSYDYNTGSDYKEKVVRFTYDGTTLSDPKTIFDNIAASGIHNGSRLLISSDLKLFITTGDASNQKLPQSKTAINGKILRLNLDGTVPSDNPIAGNPIWTWGHRNPQGLVLANGILYSSEHGPDSDDEINIIEKGRNYGWPNVKGFCDNSNERTFCSANNIKEPFKTWTPTAAVCGLDYYNNNHISQWKNSLLLVSLKNARLYQLKLNSAGTQIVETHEFFHNTYGRLRDLCISPDGKVYISTSNGSNDKIIVISK